MRLLKVAICTGLLTFLLSLTSVATADWIYNHVFGVTDKAPFATAFAEDENGKRALRNLIEYYQDVESTIRQSEEKSSDLPFKIIPQLIAHNGWPPLSEESQRVYLPHMKGNGKMDQFKVTERVVFRNLRAFAAAVARTGPTIHRLTSLDVEKFFGTAFVTHTTDVNICNMRTNVAYRINGEWFVNAVLTDDEPTITKAEGQRKFVGEFLNFDTSGKVKSAPMFYNMTFKPSSAKYWSGSPIEKTASEHCNHKHGCLGWQTWRESVRSWKF